MPPPFSPIARTGIAGIVLVATLALGLASAAGQPAKGDRFDAAQLPPQGIYEGCPLANGEECVSRLEEIDAAGFRHVLNYSAWYGSPAEVLRYADVAAELGLSLIWPLNHPAWRGGGSLAATYPSFAGSRRDLSNAELTTLAVGLVAAHPATWGFYVGDELPRREADRVGALSATVRKLAPGKSQLYVARPGTMRLEPFAPLVDLVGVDVYPVGSGGPAVSHASRTARAVAEEAGARTAIVLQAFSWSQYRPGALAPRYPDGERLRAMRDAAIREGDPSLILWYSYQDIVRSDRPRRRWLTLVRAAFSPLH